METEAGFLADFYPATRTFKRGLDPNNVITPLKTSVAETISIPSLMATSILFDIH
jgi:cation transporter-like permease